jgi:hypothetical protein
LDRSEAESRIESTFEALRAEATARLRPSLNIVTVERVRRGDRGSMRGFKVRNGGEEGIKRAV